MRYLMLCLVAFTISLFAQPTVKGKLSADVTWSGQVRIIGDVIVPKGVTLTIAPGTQVLMAAKKDQMASGKYADRIEITVSGKLIAQGTKGTGRILFTSDAAQPQMNDWIGISIKNPREQSLIQYSTIEYGYKGITTYGSSPQVIDCEIRYNEYAGVSAEVRSKPLIQNCNVNSNGFAGIISELASFPLIERSIITQNEIGVIVFDRSQVDLGQSNAGAGQSIGANYIFNNFDNNIYNRSSKTVFAQNNLWNINAATEIQQTLYDRNQNPGYGEILFQPLFDDTNNNNALLASRTDTQSNRRTSSPQVAQSPPPRQNNTATNTSTSTQPIAANQANTRLNNANTASNKPAQNPPATNQPQSNNNATANQPDANTPATNENANPGSVEYLADRSNESNAVKTLIDNANQNEPATNNSPIAGLVSSTTPNKPAVAVPQVTEPIIEGLLDTKGRKYVRKVTPAYPEIYQRTGHEGKVLMEVIVARDGTVESHRVLKSDGELFTESASKAIGRFRYKPGTFQGKPVRFKIVEPFFFRLSLDN